MKAADARRVVLDLGVAGDVEQVIASAPPISLAKRQRIAEIMRIVGPAIPVQGGDLSGEAA